MAIAFDAVASAHQTGNPITSLSFTSGTTGTLTNGAAFVIVASTNTVSGVTWNGVAMTNVGGWNGFQVGPQTIFELLNPPAGAVTVAVTTANSNGIGAFAITYSGVKQSLTLDNSTTDTSASKGTETMSLTTVADNCFTLMFIQSSGTYSASTGSTGRGTPVGGATTATISLFDSGSAITPAGSYSMSATRSGTGILDSIMFSIAPYVAVASTGNFLTFM